jgi:putative heme iron utilization protein
MDQAMTHALRELVRAQTVGALGTLHQGEPFVSMVPFVALPGGGFAIHVSGLAAHTRDMRAHARVSLLIIAPESAGSPAQARARVTVQGDAAEVGRSSEEYTRLKAAYLDRFPQSEQTFGLGDFSLFRIQPVSARFIGGFAQAVSLTPESLEAALGG